MEFSELLRSEGQSMTLGKGEHVFRQGEGDKSFYYVRSGLLKAFYVSDDGKEFIKSFIVPGDFIGCMTSAYLGGTCAFGLLCLAPTQLDRIPFERLYWHSRADLELAHFFIDRLLQLAMKKERREYEFLCLSAEARYRALVESAPTLLEQVTQNDLARYLGLTPVGLSRIKRRIHGG